MIENILLEAIEKQASDIFIVAGCSVAFKVNGRVRYSSCEKLTPEGTRNLIEELYRLAERTFENELLKDGDDDFSVSINTVGRFRVSVYRQRGSFAAVLRVVSFELPDPDKLFIPKNVMELAKKQNGMVLVTGSAGSGKSTTLSCLISAINNSRECHIMTLEDPIEYIYKHGLSIVSQREISSDAANYATALKSVLRQAPDVILIGEMRDAETINIAMTAAETGHLVFSTLHTLGAANSIDRIIDAFPAFQQNQARLQLSMVLQAVVSQQLIPSKDGGLVPAFEVMLANTAIKTLIRDSKTHQLESVIFSSAAQDMITMDKSILKLYEDGIITKENALFYSTNPEGFEKKFMSNA